MSDNKYKVEITIYVNAADKEDAEYEASYQLYNDSYDKNTIIKIEEIENKDEAIEDNFSEDYYDYEQVVLDEYRHHTLD